MLDAATARRDAFISDCTTLGQAREVAQTGCRPGAVGVGRLVR